MNFKVIHGNVRDKLPLLPSNSIDAIVTDPPYELGFMGRGWDASGIAYDVNVWKEALRVLKPGGHLLAFGGTRTHHRMTCAIEDAGFEIRDELDWLYGSGFPKSLDIAQNIEKKQTTGLYRRAEQKRNVRRVDRTCAAGAVRKGLDVGANDASAGKVPLTTDNAKQWEGWGTALKPAREPIVMARKPFDDTVAANVLEHGTGAINIDACRVGANPGYSYNADKNGTTFHLWANSARHGEQGARRTADKAGTDVIASTQGRWPANLILSHSDDCECVGEKCVKTSVNHHISRTSIGGHEAYGGSNVPRLGTDYADADGMETVEQWNCVPDCPVRMLDEQSGHLVSGGTPSGRHAPKMGKNTFGTFAGAAIETGIGPSEGGASRFFYVAKSSRSERNAGCEALPNQNNHPTVKPIALMRYLVKMITPPGGIVLDPFAGSGSTGCACALEGVSFIGIELERAHVDIINARIAYWSTHTTAKVKATPKPKPSGFKSISATASPFDDE